MTSTEFTDKLHDFLYGITDDLTYDVISFRTFADAGIRYNDGLVIRLADGTEMQVTVVRSN